MFQPLLLQYFTYDELRELRQKVIQQHIIKEQIQLSKSSSGCAENTTEKESEDGQHDGKNYISQMPPEIMLKYAALRCLFPVQPEHHLYVLRDHYFRIFSHLNPRELVACKQVNHEWSRLAVAPCLWREISPKPWSRGCKN